jgi:23S rRNA (pseudouridine1915-N3)-methyltransferase
MLDDYLTRCSRTMQARCEEFRDQSAFWSSFERRRGRVAPFLVLADPKGRSLSSEALAAEFALVRDRGIQQLVVAIGPADGWSSESLDRAHLRLSFGPFTLPHELAAVIVAEQLYRVTTIWSGHPYHEGH